MKRTALLVWVAVTLVAAACSDRTPKAALDALSEGDFERVREIYASGVDPDARVNGQTALTLAACHSSAEVIEMLLEAGADPNRTSTRRLTPLIYAARCGNLAAVRVLLEAGADPSITSPGGGTALAAAREAGADEVVDLLLEAESNADGVDRGERLAPAAD